MSQRDDTDGGGSFAVDLAVWFKTHEDEVQTNLRLYFLGEGGQPFDGRHFDRFSAMGDPNTFVATDVLAVEAPIGRGAAELGGQIPRYRVGRHWRTDGRSPLLMPSTPLTVSAGRVTLFGVVSRTRFQSFRDQVGE